VKQVERVNQARRLAPLLTLFRRQYKGINQIVLAKSIAEDSETNQNEGGNQALSPSLSLPLSQKIHPIQFSLTL
jgi:hypothetical protein